MFASALVASLFVGGWDWPKPSGHAHNDYRSPAPLQDALGANMASVEADVFLVGGELLVAHDIEDTREDRTLESMYLRPLAERIKQREGKVYEHGRPLMLLVDIKSDAAPTYTVLEQQLEKFRPSLTRLIEGKLVPGALIVVVSGNRPSATMRRQQSRLAFLDGRLEDLVHSPDPKMTPLVSDDWRSCFVWTGIGPFPETDRAKLANLSQLADSKGIALRFWGSPDTKESWTYQRAAGAHLINTGRPAALQKFLEAPASGATVGRS